MKLVMKKMTCILISFVTCAALPYKVSAQEITAEPIFVMTADLVRPPVLAGTKVVYAAECLQNTGIAPSLGRCVLC